MEKRPTSVTVIGGIFILVSIFIILSTAMSFSTGLVELKQLEEQLKVEMPGVEMSGLSDQLLIGGITAFLLIIFGIFMLIASIQFLKLRAWARTVLEVASWLILVYSVGFGIFWLFTWTKISGPSYMSGMLKVEDIIPTTVYAIVFIVIIKFLRGETIKQAVTQRQEGSDDTER